MLTWLVKLFLVILRFYNYPEIVCLCGSTGKALEAFQSQNLALTKQGKIVLSIGCNTRSDEDLQNVHDIEVLKTMLDTLHKYKILLAHTVYILNVNGYVGASTRSELVYAMHLKKRIVWLEPDKMLVI